jgi:hypothetical protein
MFMRYKLANPIKDGDSVLLTKIDDDGRIWWIPNDPNNTDWQIYQAWLAEDPSHQPDPAD